VAQRLRMVGSIRGAAAGESEAVVIMRVLITSRGVVIAPDVAPAIAPHAMLSHGASRRGGGGGAAAARRGTMRAR
jgi:hypothetical protein